MEEELKKVNAELDTKRKAEGEANVRMQTYQVEVEQARLRAGEMEWRVEKKGLDIKDLQRQIAELAVGRDVPTGDGKKVEQRKKAMEEVEIRFIAEVKKREAVEAQLGEAEWRAEKTNYDVTQLKKTMAEMVKEKEEIQVEMKRMAKGLEELAAQKQVVQEVNGKLADATAKLGETEWRLERKGWDMDKLKKQLAETVAKVASLEEELAQLTKQKQGGGFNDSPHSSSGSNSAMGSRGGVRASK